MGIGRNKKVMFCLSTLAAVVWFSTASLGAGQDRIIPQGKVTLYEDGKPVGAYTSEAPLPFDTVMVCHKRCGVQMRNLLAVAEDETAFSLLSDDSGGCFRVREGTIYFALHRIPRPIRFETPQVMLTAEALALDASTGEDLLKGYVSVSEGKTEIGVAEGGSLVVSTPQGPQTVRSGSRLVFAQAALKGSAAAARGAHAAARAHMTAGQSLTVLEVIGAAMTGAGVYAESDDDGSPHSVSPFAPSP